jgi:hypothetical protein
MTQMLQELETELEARYETVNRRILSGENTQIKLKQKNGETLWTLPYPSGEDTVNDPLFDGCHCLDAFTNILGRYVYDKVHTSLVGFKHPSQYGDAIIRPVRKA